MIRPFVQWDNRKIPMAVYDMVPEFTRFIEPFTGDGSLLWILKPKKATINIHNKRLANLYLHIKHRPMELINIVNILDEAPPTPEYFARIRSWFFSDGGINKQDFTVEGAAALLWLDKHCLKNSEDFDGIPYKEFNPEIKERTIDPMDIIEASEYLRNNDIIIGNFVPEITSTIAKDGDFVFLYPPKGYDEDEVSKCFDGLVRRNIKTMLIANDDILTNF